MTCTLRRVAAEGVPAVPLTRTPSLPTVVEWITAGPSDDREDSPCEQRSSTDRTSPSASDPTRGSRTRPTRSCVSCWPACAVRTSGTTGASPTTPSARSATSSSASSKTSVAEVSGIAVGDLVIAPFIFSDMSCPHCRQRLDDLLRSRRQLRQRHHRRRPRRSRPGPARRQHARQGARLRPLRRRC